MKWFSIPAIVALLLSPHHLVAQQVSDLVRVTGKPDKDLGLCPVGTDASRRVWLDNIAGVPLLVELVSKSCGCVSFTIDSPLLAPGEGTVVSLQTSVESIAGPQTHGITLRVKPEAPTDTRVQELNFTMTYRPDVDYTIAPAFIVTRAVLGERLRLRAFVQDITEGALSVGPATTDLAGGVARIERTPAPPRNPGTPFDYFGVVVDFTPTTLGTTKGHIIIETNSLTSPKTAVPVTIHTVSAWHSSEAGFILTNGGGAPVFMPALNAVLASPQADKDKHVSARVEPAVPFCDVRIDRAEEPGRWNLGVRLDRERLPPYAWQGSILVEGEGAVLLSLPIVWINTAAAR